jgi:hypothetical protein
VLREFTFVLPLIVPKQPKYLAPANLSVVVNVVTVTEWKGKPLPGW